MGRFVNPDNSAFQVALNSRIYVDKTGLISTQTVFLIQQMLISAIGRKSYAANMLAAY